MRVLGKKKRDSKTSRHTCAAQKDLTMLSRSLLQTRASQWNTPCRCAGLVICHMLAMWVVNRDSGPLIVNFWQLYRLPIFSTSITRYIKLHFTQIFSKIRILKSGTNPWWIDDNRYHDYLLIWKSAGNFVQRERTVSDSCWLLMVDTGCVLTPQTILCLHIRLIFYRIP